MNKRQHSQPGGHAGADHISEYWSLDCSWTPLYIFIYIYLFIHKYIYIQCDKKVSVHLMITI